MLFFEEKKPANYLLKVSYLLFFRLVLFDVTTYIFQDLKFRVELRKEV